MYSIVIPYLKTSKYIEQCKHYLQENSSLEYELVEIVNETDVYYAYNLGVYRAKYDKVILLNDDMFVSRGWDVPMVRYITEDVLTTCYVVEPDPGTITRNDNTTIQNVKYDCGKTLNEFDYTKFQTFVESQTVPVIQENTKGWYMPLGVHKKSFVSYPNRLKAEANDILLLDYVLPNLGYKFARVNSFVYHFQQRSLRER